MKTLPCSVAKARTMASTSAPAFGDLLVGVNCWREDFEFEAAVV